VEVLKKRGKGEEEAHLMVGMRMLAKEGA